MCSLVQKMQFYLHYSMRKRTNWYCIESTYKQPIVKPNIILSPTNQKLGYQKCTQPNYINIKRKKRENSLSINRSRSRVYTKLCSTLKPYRELYNYIYNRYQRRAYANVIFVHAFHHIWHTTQIRMCTKGVYQTWSRLHKPENMHALKGWPIISPTTLVINLFLAHSYAHLISKLFHRYGKIMMYQTTWLWRTAFSF